MYTKLFAAAALLSAVAAAPAEVDREGRVSVMESKHLMRMKEEWRQKEREMGIFAKGTYPQIQKHTPCVNGKAGEFSCNNVDLHSFISHTELGSKTGEGNDVWGWTSADGREFGIFGQTDGTAFVEIKNDGSMVFVAHLSTSSPGTSAIWRDMKVIGDYAYIGSEVRNHGLQIVDLRQLLTVAPGKPKELDLKKDIVTYKGFGSSHNIVVNAASNTVYAVGSTTCGQGLHAVNVANPLSPVAAGCYSGDGYTHDAQCVTYNGPDTRYKGREVCFNYNEDSLTIVDVTDKTKGTQGKIGKLISRTEYVGSAYTHQGWLLDDSNQSMIMMDDELDEKDGTSTAKSGNTVTYLWNVSDLTKPKLVDNYKSPARAIDHNQYSLNGHSYMANYGSGLRIVDARTAVSAQSTKGFKEVGFFDVHPEDDKSCQSSGCGQVEFFGSWSTYIYFKSGYILVNSIERGAFCVKRTN